jgi:hypothetical protein
MYWNIDFDDLYQIQLQLKELLNGSNEKKRKEDSWSR